MKKYFFLLALLLALNLQEGKGQIIKEIFAELSVGQGLGFNKVILETSHQGKAKNPRFTTSLGLSLGFGVGKRGDRIRLQVETDEVGGVVYHPQISAFHAGPSVYFTAPENYFGLSFQKFLKYNFFVEPSIGFLAFSNMTSVTLIPLSADGQSTGSIFAEVESPYRQTPAFALQVGKAFYLGKKKGHALSLTLHGRISTRKMGEFRVAFEDDAGTYNAQHDIYGHSLSLRLAYGFRVK